MDVDVLEDAGLTTGLSVREQTERNVPDNEALDKFVKPDARNLGMSFYSAHRLGPTTRNAHSQACAVREPTRGVVGKVVRLQYDLPELLSKHALAWAAHPMSGNKGSPLFKSEASSPWMGTMRDALLTKCVPICKEHHCADWHLFRRFRLTATTLSRLLKPPHFQCALGLGSVVRSAPVAVRMDGTFG